MNQAIETETVEPELHNRPIIIATIMREYGTTGVQTHFNSYSRYLRDHGLETKIVTPFSAPALLVYPMFSVRPLIDRISGTASVWWYMSWHYAFLKFALRHTLRRATTPLTIYAQCPTAAKAALEVRVTPKQRVVMAAHLNISQADEWANRGRISKDGRLYAAIRRREAEILPQVDGLVYVSNFVRSKVEETIPGVRAVASVVLPNFIARPDPSDQPSVTGDIITIGTLEPRKNQSFLIEVLAEAKRIGNRYTLTIVGEGQDRWRLESLARKLGVADQIRFLGFVPKASRLIPGHRIYCHTAKMESFGIVLIEAMACGLPVIAAPVGGIPEAFADGVEGRYWPLDDAVFAARILISVADDAERYASMGKAALRRFSMCYEIGTVAAKLDDFLRQDSGDDCSPRSGNAGAE